MTSPGYRSFHFTGTGRVLHGAGAVAALPEEVARLGGNRACIVTGNSLASKTPRFTRLRDLLGPACVGTMTDVRQHVPKSNLAAVAEADIIISLGGSRSFPSSPRRSRPRPPAPAVRHRVRRRSCTCSKLCGSGYNHRKSVAVSWPVRLTPESAKTMSSEPLPSLSTST